MMRRSGTDDNDAHQSACCRCSGREAAFATRQASSATRIKLERSLPAPCQIGAQGCCSVRQQYSGQQLRRRLRRELIQGRLTCVSRLDLSRTLESRVKPYRITEDSPLVTAGQLLSD